jgi:hypothetical protein
MRAIGPRRADRAVVVALLAAILLAGCGIAAPAGSPLPPPSEGPVRTPTGAVLQTRIAIEAALRSAELALTDPQVAFRPAESPRVAAAPRTVYQVVLPEDPAGGFIVVYEFSDAGTASTAGNELAEYLGSGPGRVQFASDTRFVLRQLGTTLVFFPWSPGSSPDPRAPKIEEALRTLGFGFDVPGAA